MKKIGKPLLPESVSWTLMGFSISFVVVVGAGLMLAGLLLYGIFRPKKVGRIFKEIKENFQYRGLYK